MVREKQRKRERRGKKEKGERGRKRERERKKEGFAHRNDCFSTRWIFIELSKLYRHRDKFHFTPATSLMQQQAHPQNRVVARMLGVNIRFPHGFFARHLCAVCVFLAISHLFRRLKETTRNINDLNISSGTLISIKETRVRTDYSQINDCKPRFPSHLLTEISFIIQSYTTIYSLISLGPFFSSHLSLVQAIANGRPTGRYVTETFTQF